MNPNKWFETSKQPIRFIFHGTSPDGDNVFVVVEGESIVRPSSYEGVLKVCEGKSSGLFSFKHGDRAILKDTAMNVDSVEIRWGNEMIYFAVMPTMVLRECDTLEFIYNVEVYRQMM